MVNPLLGQLVTVELTETVAGQYNSANAALDDVKVGTPRPALVVAVNEAHQSPDPTQKNSDGTPVMHDVPESVNLAIFHDGALAPYYVQHVPSDVLTKVGEAKNAPKEQAAPEEAQNQGENAGGRHWDPNREGTGEPYTGPGPSAPNLTGPTQNDPPAPGTVVPGEGRAQSSGQSPEQWS